MDWLVSLFTGDGVAHTILAYALVIPLGIMLGKVKVFGISLGATLVLFVGIIAGHFGLKVNSELLHFIREFGLILFVFAIGLQVGPGFFSSFKKGGMLLNLLAVSVVILGVVVTIGLYYSMQGRVPMPMMVGIMSGAVTNTPGLGAAQEALQQLVQSGQLAEVPQIALGYAVAYPLGVIGIILALILVRLIFCINLQKETESIEKEKEKSLESPEVLSLHLTNPALDGRKLLHIKELLGREFVVSRVKRGDNFFIPLAESELFMNDYLLVVAIHNDEEAIVSFLGEEVELDWEKSEEHLVSRRIVITQNNINGKTLASLHLRTAYGVSVTRIMRSGLDLLASPDLVLQVGDRVVVVGEKDAIKKVELRLGNTLKRLDEPHVATIFIGIFLGIVLGSVPLAFPGIPMPVKLGLAGGPLVVAILLGRFGYKLKLITYTTASANHMLREVGICLFLASVGLASGPEFFETVFAGDGLLWIGCGFLITVLPLLIIGFVGRQFMKINYYTLIGMLSGSYTDPPALAYANSLTENDAPAVAYSTVYPLTMFCRVIFAQILILIFA